MNDEQSNGYQTYMLRLWRAQCQGTWQWRASLESRHTGERQLFASLRQLFAFLGERCDSQTPAAPDTLRIRIWWEVDGIENPVYDNGFNQPIGAGNIVVHTGR